VTGALVLLQFISLFLSFLLCARPFSLFSLWFASCLYFGQAHYALHKYGLCCPLSLWWSCGSLHELPCGAREIVLVLCSCWCASLSSWFYCAPRCAWVGPVASFVVCPPLLWFLSLSPLPSLPAGCLVWCSGPACTLVCWYLPLGSSCDGLVALPSCWECG